MKSLLQSSLRWFLKLFGVLPSNREQALSAEQLEPRILYSAAPVEAPAAEAIEEAPAEVASASAPAQQAAPSVEAPVAVEAPAEVTATEGEGEVSPSAAVELIDVDDAAASLNQEMVESLAAEARQRWIDSGISAEQIAALDSVSYQVADVGGAHLGVAEGFLITIDDDAGGAGVGNWFIDSTPGEDTEFVRGASAVNGRFDLLSTLIHEQGHVLGLGDLYGQRENVMNGFLDAGTRRMPTVGQADGAVAGSMSGANFLTANIVRASTDENGVEANSHATSPTLSADGRFVAFHSGASNLVAGDTNGSDDVFVKDLATGEITRVSTDSNGTEGIGSSYQASISADGRYVTFGSQASNLVSDDTNGRADIFVKDLLTGTTTRVSTGSDGTQANDTSQAAAISGNGRYVVFFSRATDLLSEDSDGVEDVFLKDLKTGKLTLISSDSSGVKGNDESYRPSISADGRYITFSSSANNLVAGDSNGSDDVFVKDRISGKLTLVSSSASGEQGNDFSEGAKISEDGRFVVFLSGATNLVSGDTNGESDLFVKNLKTGEISRVNTTAIGGESSGVSLSGLPSLSADGRFVTFTSDASDLVAGDTNGLRDVFVKDMLTGEISRVNTMANGTETSGILAHSSRPVISADGGFVAFDSRAENLVAGDTNSFDDVFVKGISALTSTYTTSVEIDPATGNLIIEDIGGDDTADQLFVGLVDGRLEISDKKATVGSSIIGSMAVGTKGRGVSVDLSAFTGGLIIRTNGGDDRVTIGDLSGIDGDIVVESSLGHDKLSQKGDVVLSALGGLTYDSEEIRLERGSSIIATDGDIDINPQRTGAADRRYTGFYANGATLQSTNGEIDINAEGGDKGNGNKGAYLRNTQISSVDGDVTLRGEAEGKSGNIGVQLAGTTGIHVSGNGEVEVRGTVAAEGNGNRGTYLQNGVAMSTQGDQINVSGAVFGANSGNTAVDIRKVHLESDSGSGTGIYIGGNVNGGTGSRNTGTNLKGATVIASDGGFITVSGDVSVSEPGSRHRGVVLTSTNISAESNSVQVLAVFTGIFGGLFGTGNSTAILAKNSQLSSQSDDVSVTAGSVDSGSVGSGNRGIDLRNVDLMAGADVAVKSTIVYSGESRNEGVRMTGGSAIASGGTVSIEHTRGNTTTGSNNTAVNLNRVTLDGQAGVSIQGKTSGGANNNTSVKIDRSTITSLDEIDIIGLEPNSITGNNNRSISLRNSALTANGIITVHGNGEAGGNGNTIVEIRGGDVMSLGSDVDITATSNEMTTGKNNLGVDLRGVDISADTNIIIDATGSGGTNNNVGLSIRGGSLNALAEGINLTATAQSSSTGKGNTGLLLNGVDVSAAENVVVTGTGGGGTDRNVGIDVRKGSITSSGFDVSLIGIADAGTTGSKNVGVQIASASVQATAGGVNIDGTGGGGLNDNRGTSIIGSTITANSGSGAIVVDGTARMGTTGVRNIGLYLFNKVTIDGYGDFEGIGGGGNGLNHGIYANRKISVIFFADADATAGAGVDSEEAAGAAATDFISS